MSLISCKSNRSLRNSLSGKSRNLITCLISLYKYPESLSRNSWRSKVFNLIHSIPSLDGTDKFPEFDDLVKILWNEIDYDSISAIDADITERSGVGRQVDVVQFSNVCKNYIHWLATQLSSTGSVFRYQVYAKLRELGLIDDVWRKVVGYEGLYEVSVSGKVRSTDRIVSDSLGRRRQLKGELKGISISSDGYCHVSLSKDGVEKHCQLHRIVAAAFIPNPDTKPQVNHKDGNKQNNCANNLEWVSAQENTQHAIDFGLRQNVGYTSHTSPSAKQTFRYLMKRCKPVMNMCTGEIYKSHSAAAKALKVNPTSVDEAITKHRPVRGVQLRELCEAEKLNYFKNNTEVNYT